MNSAKIRRCRALDCGAGIGGVTKNLLLPLFDAADMLEVNQNFSRKLQINLIKLLNSIIIIMIT